MSNSKCFSEKNICSGIFLYSTINIMITIIYSVVLNDRGHAINPHINIKHHTRLSRHKTEECQNLGSSNKLHTRDHACQVCD